MFIKSHIEWLTHVRHEMIMKKKEHAMLLASNSGPGAVIVKYTNAKASRHQTTENMDTYSDFRVKFNGTLQPG
jgi:hypothetical protein